MTRKYEVEREYVVDWMAPNYSHLGHTTVKASNKTRAIAKAKRRLGSKVKKGHRFSAVLYR